MFLTVSISIKEKKRLSSFISSVYALTLVRQTKQQHSSTFLLLTRLQKKLRYRPSNPHDFSSFAFDFERRNAILFFYSFSLSPFLPHLAIPIFSHSYFPILLVSVLSPFLHIKEKREKIESKLSSRIQRNKRPQNHQHQQQQHLSQAKHSSSLEISCYSFTLKSKKT